MREREEETTFAGERAHTEWVGGIKFSRKESEDTWVTERKMSPGDEESI